MDELCDYGEKNIQAEETAGKKFSWWASACNIQAVAKRPPWLVGSERGGGVVRSTGAVLWLGRGYGVGAGRSQKTSMFPLKSWALILSEEEPWRDFEQRTARI